MESYANVIGVFSAPKGQTGLPRPRQARLMLEEGYGIRGDKFAGKALDQTVMIVGTKAYALAEEAGVILEPGSLGENILIDGDPHALPVGTQLRIAEALLEITEACTLCDHLSVFDRRLPRLVRRDRGVYCRILRSGSVTADDRVWVEERMSA